MHWQLARTVDMPTCAPGRGPALCLIDCKPQGPWWLPAPSRSRLDVTGQIEPHDMPWAAQGTKTTETGCPKPCTSGAALAALATITPRPPSPLPQRTGPVHQQPVGAHGPHGEARGPGCVTRSPRTASPHHHSQPQVTGRRATILPSAQLQPRARALCESHTARAAGAVEMLKSEVTGSHRRVVGHTPERGTFMCA